MRLTGLTGIINPSFKNSRRMRCIDNGSVAFILSPLFRMIWSSMI